MNCFLLNKIENLVSYDNNEFCNLLLTRSKPFLWRNMIKSILIHEYHHLDETHLAVVKQLTHQEVSIKVRQQEDLVGATPPSPTRTNRSS